MVAYQRIKDTYNPKNEDYIYLFGGIKVMNSTDLKQLAPDKAKNTTSYMFMADLWRYDLIANQWETVEVYGISEITRDLFLWNGTRIKMDVATKDRLGEDLNNTKVAQQTNEEADRLKGLRLPQKRGGHMITIAGNPPDYIIIFGGTSIEYLLGDDALQGVNKIKSTLNDFWVFNIRKKQWEPVFPNSKDNPGPTEWGQLITFQPDRMIVMYGGQFGEKLYDDLWLYNINNNLW